MHKFYKIVILPTIHYGTKCQVVKKQYIHKMSLAKIKLLRWINRNTRNNRIRNMEICLRQGLAVVDENIRKSDLRWFNYVQRGVTNTLVRNNKFIQVKRTKM